MLATLTNPRSIAQRTSRQGSRARLADIGSEEITSAATQARRITAAGLAATQRSRAGQAAGRGQVKLRVASAAVT